MQNAEVVNLTSQVQSSLELELLVSCVKKQAVGKGVSFSVVLS